MMHVLGCSKIIATITDNGSNFVKAFKMFVVKLSHFDNSEDIPDSIDLFDDTIENDVEQEDEYVCDSLESTNDTECSSSMSRLPRN